MTFYSNLPDEKGSLGPTAAPPHSYPQGWLVPLLSLVLVYDTRMLKDKQTRYKPHLLLILLLLVALQFATLSCKGAQFVLPS